MMGRTVLVTGGCGFIGSHFVRHLCGKGHGLRVVNFDKLTYSGNLANLRDLQGETHYSFERGDIADSEFVDSLFGREKPWGVVNFAAETHVDRSILDASPFIRTNVLGVQVLLDAARQHGTERFVQISTDEVYGDAAGMPPFSEEALLRPSSPYAASKAAADLLCLAYHRTHDLPVVVVRSANNYGAFQFPEKLIPLVVSNALAGGMLPIYGDGKQVRDWLYVPDNCAAIMRALEKGKVGAVYNVGTEESRPNLDVVQAICQILAEETGTDPFRFLERMRFIPDRPGHDRKYALNTERIRGELGWEAAVSFEQGLRETVRWYLANRDWVEQVTSGEYKSYYASVYVRNWGRT